MKHPIGDPTTGHDSPSVVVLRRPNMPPPSSSSASAQQAPLRRILPLDPSAYSDPLLHPSALTPSSITLSELAHLIRFQGYQEQRRSQSRIRLHRWLVCAALSSRLLRCGQLAYKTLLECFRDDDKKGFAALHAALHDVRNSCDATRRYALLEPDLETRKSNLPPTTDPAHSSFSTFMHDIPAKIRNELLAFVSEIRTNPEFLAGRISGLTQQELQRLTSFHPTVDQNEFAVMASRGVPIINKKAGVSPSANSVERLLSFHRHDPLSALIYTIFANSSGPDSPEDIRRTEAWATTCARLIVDWKPGHERLLRSILDAWAGMRAWPVKPKLEIFLMQVLQEGQFLLENPEPVPRKPGSVLEKPFDKPTAYLADEFFDRKVQVLFALIDGEPSAGGLPEGAIEIGHAILKKLGHSKKHRFAEIKILYTWFFSYFLPHALIYPEVRPTSTGGKNVVYFSLLTWRL
jgi:hypothetical protein